MADPEPKPDSWLEWHLDKDRSRSPLFRPVLLRGLQRLNQLPRTDPFWRQTNLEPTVHKLAEFCELMLRRNPEDDEARVISAALRMDGGAAPTEQLLPWLSKDPSRCEWVIMGCEHAFRMGGRDVAQDVRPVLEPFLPRLQEPQRSRARSFLDGRDPWAQGGKK